MLTWKAKKNPQMKLFSTSGYHFIHVCCCMRSSSYVSLCSCGFSCSRLCCAALQKCKQWTRACTISCSELLRIHLMALMASVEFQGYKPKDSQRTLIIRIMLLWCFAAEWTDVLAQNWWPHEEGTLCEYLEGTSKDINQEVKAWVQMGLPNGQST